MSRLKSNGVVVGALILGLALGVAWAKNAKVESEMYVGKSPTEAAAALQALAEQQAGKGTWERIAVARVYFLSDQTAKGQAIFDAIAVDDEPSDWIRMGRVYNEVGDWPKAKDAFDRVLAKKPKDEDWLAEIGAYYNLHGDREAAEEFFRRSFAEDAENHRNTSMVAGSYLGVQPDP